MKIASQHRGQAFTWTYVLQLSSFDRHEGPHHDVLPIGAGVFSPGQFTAPIPGTNGNEKTQQFRQPWFSEVDLAAFKDTRLTGRFNFQIRFEFYNLFNYDNLYLGNDMSTGGFGKAISQQLPRWWRIGAKLTF